MKFDSDVIKSATVTPHWQDLVRKYQIPDGWRSVWQIANSVIPYIAMWYLMYRSLSVSYWLTLSLAPLAAGFMTRTFIILHDCGHGSFFKSSKANHVVGTICGVLTHTPYFQWTREHAIHHASSGDLSRRGVGDVDTLTVKEYLALSKWGRLKYRLYRSPLVLLVIGPQYIFLFRHRFTSKVSGPRERNNLYLTNLGLFAFYGSLGLLIGLKALLLIFAPIMIISGAVGVWLFYVQHQYENTYWRNRGEWDYATSALLGSSYYKLPRVLQWFSGNIGFHHIHHLSPKIPNYKLQRCHEENPLFQESTVLGLRTSLKSASLKLWDEERGRMVDFRQIR
ncbi:MAG: fatty acid desaturase [Blastocatellia bacterium]|nr:fatty acid desaturase [Blastocatellia bacterium]